MIKDCVQCGVQNAYAYPHTWRSPVSKRCGNPDVEIPVTLSCEYCTADCCAEIRARVQQERYTRNQAKIAQWKEEEC